MKGRKRHRRLHMPLSRVLFPLPPVRRARARARAPAPPPRAASPPPQVESPPPHSASPPPSPAPPSYVVLVFYLAKGYLVNRGSTEAVSTFKSWGKDVDDIGIHYLKAYPEPAANLSVHRKFDLPRNLDEGLKERLKRSWFVISQKIEQDELDRDVFFVNDELRKHGRRIVEFDSGEEVVEFACSRSEELGIDCAIKSLRASGAFGRADHFDRHGHSWHSVLGTDMITLLGDIFPVCPFFSLHRRSGRDYIQEFKFLCDLSTGSLVDHTLVFPGNPEFRWATLNNADVELDPSKIYVSI